MHFESYKKSELDSVNEIFKFLDLAPISKYDRIGKRIIVKEKVFGGKQYALVGPMLQKTRDALEHFYQPFNKKLAELLEDDRFSWT